MTGVELTVVWLSGLFLGAVTVTAVAKARAEARVKVVQAQLEASRLWLDAQKQRGPLFMPADWTKDGER